MVRKPARMYTPIAGQVYTRREYMGGVPANKIVQYDAGNPRGDFPITLTLLVKESCQIRDSALEAARITANREITLAAGETGYHLKIRVYPHHVLRENKQAMGAGADRVSMGMRMSFGKAIGTAARVKPNQKLITLRTTVNCIKAAKEALRKASMKLPTPCSVIVEKGAELIK